MLTQKRIGALVITGADRRIAGILSERDIVHSVARHGASALDEPVSSAMTREVVTCREDETIPNLMQRMTAGRFRHMPVLERGRLSGIVSIGDLAVKEGRDGRVGDTLQHISEGVKERG